jgi:hypothetical protein
MLDLASENTTMDLSQMVAIWSALLLLTMIALALLIGRPDRNRGDEEDASDGITLATVTPWRAQLTAQVEELGRHAEQLMAVAEIAAATSAQRRTEWVAAREEAEAAARAYEAADDEVRRVAATLALPVPYTPQTPSEYSDRERYLHRAVRAAHDRGELSAEQLADALAHRNGWDPRLHPVEQEIVIRRAIRAHRLIERQQADERERIAWQVAETAAMTARELREEAFAALRRAEEAHRRLATVGERRGDTAVESIVELVEASGAERDDERAGEETVQLPPLPARWRAARAS